MLEKDFTKHKSGRFVKNLQGVSTFAPDPLPDRLSLPLPLVREISALDNALGRLDGTAKSLPDQKILIRSFVRREAQLSSYIENTFARYEELAAAEDVDQATLQEPVRETLNAERAIQAGIEAVFNQGKAVTLSLIRRMHELLLQDVRGHGSRGKFRQVQVYIGATHDLEQARFVPPAPHIVDELMQRFEQALTRQTEFPPVVELALLHYQFEAIHPFEDGNGRLGRILILLGLCQHQLLTVPLFNASLYFERYRQQYYDALLHVSTHGDWLGWIEFFVKGLRVAADQSLAKINELVQFRAEYQNVLRTAQSSALRLKLADQLFVRPVITIPQAARIMDVTYPAAKSSVEKLVDLGILTEFRSNQTPAHFVADAILKAVNAEPTRR
jgi:Fic family protein